MNYTVAQVASMFEKKPTEISAIVRKGGIKGLTVEESDDGVRYLLSEQAVDQLGAMFGTSPKELKQARSITIDKKAFEKEVKRIGVKAIVMSKACGMGDNYVSQAITREKISVEVLEKLEHIFGLRSDMVIVREEEPKPAKKETAKAPELDTAAISEAVKAAVFNGMIDAFIELAKGDFIKTSIVRAFDSDEFRQGVNKAVYQAMKGMKMLDGRDDSHPGLIPQRRPNA